MQRLGGRILARRNLGTVHPGETKWQSKAVEITSRTNSATFLCSPLREPTRHHRFSRAQISGMLYTCCRLKPARPKAPGSIPTGPYHTSL
jgi:hypothetical protein